MNLAKSLILIAFLASCSNTADLCGSFQKFTPDPDFEQRLTTNEKRQLVAYNLKLAEFCR